jgi:hypothetical protein
MRNVLVTVHENIEISLAPAGVQKALESPRKPSTPERHAQPMSNNAADDDGGAVQSWRRKKNRPWRDHFPTGLVADRCQSSSPEAAIGELFAATTQKHGISHGNGIPKRKGAGMIAQQQREQCRAVKGRAENAIDADVLRRVQNIHESAPPVAFIVTLSRQKHMICARIDEVLRSARKISGVVEAGFILSFSSLHALLVAWSFVETCAGSQAF